MAAVKHCGEVVRVEGQSVFVRMTVNSACSGCHAKGVCGASEKTDKIVEVVTSEASAYEVGESVEVALMRNDMGPQSVILAYVVPFFVLTIALLGALAVGASEGVAVVASLVGVVVWYVVLYALRSKIKDRIKFIIIK